MSWVRRCLGDAQPSDLVFLAYVGISGLLVLAFGWQLTSGLWIGLTLSHLAILVIGVWWSGRTARHPSVAGR